MKEIKLSSSKVTVVMPVYNTASWVGKSIESIKAQRHKNWELIVVDDGSTDGSLDEIMKAIDNEPRARYRYQKNQGTGGALNTGFFDCEARSLYYSWCSSDNIYNENFLSNLVIALELNKNYDFAYADFSYINEKNQVINEVRHKPIPRTDLINGYDLGPIFMFRSDLFKKTGGYWKHILEDYEFAVKCAQYTEFLLVPQILGSFRIRQGQITGSRKEEESKLAEQCRQLAKKILSNDQ